MARRHLVELAVLVLVYANLLAACDRTSSVAVAGERSEPVGELVVDQPEPRSENPNDAGTVPWGPPGGEWPTVASLDTYVEPPPGYRRVDLEAESFGSFLRQLPVRLDRRRVRSHAGRPLGSPSAGIVAMPLVDGNLQQCADSILRLYAEFLWMHDRRDEIQFHFTSGDRSDWADWRDGERFRIHGATVERHEGAPPQNSRANFRRYLRHLFMYAGTHSLPMDARTLDPSESTRPGDVFLESGAPGHVVLVLDVAENDDGERVALIGQGFMPAQEFHLVEAEGPATIGGVWFELPEAGEVLETPSWRPFGHDQRWRLADGNASGTVTAFD